MKPTFRILVVDDNRAMTEALADVFETRGYEVDVAFDGIQAIERVKGKSFDCILMDIRMPNMNGVAAFREIKKLAPSTAVILMTAYSVQGLIEEARSEGVLAVIQKPFAVQKILRIVEELQGSASVLIVDSSPESDLTAALEQKGYRVAVATSVSRALELASTGSYDAVLLDLEIQGLTTPDSVVLFRQCDPKCLIILMSVAGQQDFGTLAYAALQKPFKVSEVVLLLERIRTQKVREKFGDELFEV